jgi:hypothetical protein
MKLRPVKYNHINCNRLKWISLNQKQEFIGNTCTCNSFTFQFLILNYNWKILQVEWQRIIQGPNMHNATDTTCYLVCVSLVSLCIIVYLPSLCVCLSNKILLFWAWIPLSPLLQSPSETTWTWTYLVLTKKYETPI